MKNHHVNLVRSCPPLTGEWLCFGWTTGNQFASHVSITVYSLEGRIIRTWHLSREKARTRWSKLLGDGWKRQN